LKLREQRIGKTLGEDVDKLQARRDVMDVDVPDSNTLTDEVDGEVDDTDIVEVDQHAPSEGAVKFLEKLAQPTRLSHPISNSPILSLGVGT
jgi:NifB/MoaA-like Fe-S oxidoreductase